MSNISFSLTYLEKKNVRRHSCHQLGVLLFFITLTTLMMYSKIELMSTVSDHSRFHITPWLFYCHFVKDNCGSLLKGFLRFYVFLLVCLFVVVVWRGENRSQRSEKALWSHWSNGIHVQKYGQSYSHGLFTFLCMDPSYAPSITFTTSFPAPHFLLTKWVLPLGLHSCLLRLHVKICGNMLITLKKTMADFLPMVSMSFENEPSETI